MMTHGNHGNFQDVAWASNPCTSGLMPTTCVGSSAHPGGFFCDRPAGNCLFAVPRLPCSMGILPMHRDGTFDGGIKSNHSFMPNRRRSSSEIPAPGERRLPKVHGQDAHATYPLLSPKRLRSHSEGQILGERRLPKMHGRDAHATYPPLSPKRRRSHSEGQIPGERRLPKMHGQDAHATYPPLSPKRRRSHSEGQIPGERRLPKGHGQDAHATYPPLNPKRRGRSFSGIAVRKSLSRLSFPLHDLMRQLGITLCSFVFLGC
jgi:hypothetical protein